MTQYSTLNVKLSNSQLNELKSVNIKLSKPQLHKIRQSGGFLGRLSGPLLKTELSLIGNVLKPLAKSVLIPLGLTATVSTTDTAIHKKMFGSGRRPSDLASRTTKLRTSNEEMNDIIKIVNSLEGSGLLIKGISGTTKNEAKERKGGFL